MVLADAAEILPALDSRDSKLSVRLFADDEIELLRTDWLGLQERMEYPTPFSQWEWARAWQLTFAGRSRVLVAAIYDGSGVRAIVPWATTVADRHSAVAPATWELCASEHVFPDPMSIVAPAADLPGALLIGLRALFQAEPGCLQVRLPFVYADSAMFRSAVHAAPDFPQLVSSEAVAPFLPTNGGYADFLAGLSSNERYKIRSRTRKLLVGANVRYEALAVTDARHAMEQIRELHARRSKHKAVVSSFDTPDVQRFHGLFLEQLPRKFWMLRCLRAADQVIAIFYGFRLGGRVFYFQLGYDPEWSSYSPGIVLLSETIREAFETQCTEFNFLQGDEAFKKTWTKARRELVNFTFYQQSWSGHLRCQYARISMRTRRWAKARWQRDAMHARGN